MRIHPFTVVAELSEPLKPLRELAENLWWSWSPQARSMFRSISPHTHGVIDPYQLINSLPRAEIERLTHDPAFLGELNELSDEFRDYLVKPTWWKRHWTGAEPLVAYFCAEFAIHESLPMYSGGLGVLAGDYLKAASDLGVPVIGVGLLYSEGYFRQQLNADGWQQEAYVKFDPSASPLIPIRTSDGERLTIFVPLEERALAIQAWEVRVGRTRLILLDTNVEHNTPAHREITSRLYGGDAAMRVKQEVVLGIGGLRILNSMGVEPTICHMNEGHSAFLVLERIRQYMSRNGLNFHQALFLARQEHLFTTHTPVPAGNDAFQSELIQHLLRPFAEEMRVELSQLLGLGRLHPADAHEPFSMTVLAMRGSAHSNGVSELHGQVSRKIWSSLWPSLPAEEIPIQHVTNGVHPTTWIAPSMASLYDQHLGREWRESPEREESWSRIAHIPERELWDARNRLRHRLITFARDRLAYQLTKRGASKSEVDRARRVLDPAVLTIGFARRFATYKRGTLLFRNRDRFLSLLQNSNRPVQLIFSGKAHPADRPGKEFIAEIYQFAIQHKLTHRLVFLEDYDMDVARALVQGADIWLNNPRRPLEASGTSGMKAAMNGSLNLSVLDGWWCEAFNGANGWSIGHGEEFHDTNYQDEVESQNLLDTLEYEILPLFYERSQENVPLRWLERVRDSIRTIAPRFSAQRMTVDYVRHFYLPLLEQRIAQGEQGHETIKEAVAALERSHSAWSHVRVRDVQLRNPEQLQIGQLLEVEAEIDLGELSPHEVAVQAYVGQLDSLSSLHHCRTTPLQLRSEHSSGEGYRYEGKIAVDRVGRYGIAVRVIPVVSGKPYPLEPGLICWGE